MKTIEDIRLEAEPTPLQVRSLDPQLKREINAYAKLHDMTLAQVVTKAFNLLVANEGQR